MSGNLKIDFIEIEQFKKTGGDAYGYRTAISLTKRALERVGAEIVPGAKIAFHYTPPHFFYPIAGRVNVLFTMWEAEDFPKEFLPTCQGADFIIVPSKHSKDVLKKVGVSRTIFVCHQCYDSDFYTFFRRPKVYDKFRVLWMGAPNPRKGYDLAVTTFHKAFQGVGGVELYIKSSLFDKPGSFIEMKEYKAFLDTRNVSREELRGMYHSAQVLLYPSRGEGAGLIPMEAMAVGLPVIAPAYSGMKDYMFLDHSFPVKYSMTEVSYGAKTKVAQVDLDETISVLRYCYMKREKADDKGIKASDFIRRNFCIEVMAKRLMEILG